MIVNITKDNYTSEVLESDKPVLVDFGATWCVPCKRIEKIVTELDGEQDDVKLAKVNIEECPELAAQNGIISIPVLIFFKNGKEAGRIIGVKSKSAVLKLIEKA